MIGSGEEPAAYHFKTMAFLRIAVDKYEKNGLPMLDWDALAPIMGTKRFYDRRTESTKTRIDVFACYFGIMIYKPVRLINVAQNFIWGDNLNIVNGRLSLFIKKELVKNNKDITFQFPEWLSEMFIRTAKRINLKAGDRFFAQATKDDESISGYDRSLSLTKFILGVEINPHAFRHIMVTNYLTMFREDYVGASTICNHDIKTMLKFYNHVNYQKSLHDRAQALWDKKK
jgi:hypothetical protein